MFISSAMSGSAKAERPWWPVATSGERSRFWRATGTEDAAGIFGCGEPRLWAAEGENIAAAVGLHALFATPLRNPKSLEERCICASLGEPVRVSSGLLIASKFSFVVSLVASHFIVGSCGLHLGNHARCDVAKSALAKLPRPTIAATLSGHGGGA